MATLQEIGIRLNEGIRLTRKAWDGKAHILYTYTGSGSPNLVICRTGSKGVAPYAFSFDDFMADDWLISEIEHG